MDVKIFIGVDPGLGGAVAGIDSSGRFLFLFDIPTVEKKTKATKKTKAKVKRKIDGGELYKLILSNVDLDIEYCTALIEEQKVMHPKKIPGKPDKTMGPTQTMSLGHTSGMIECAFQISEIKHRIIPAKTWKALYKIPGGKDGKKVSLSLARMLFRSAPLNLQKHHDRAEALLLARYAFDTHVGDI